MSVFIGCGHGRGIVHEGAGEDLQEVSEGLISSGSSGRVRRPPCRGVSAIIGGGKHGH